MEGWTVTKTEVMTMWAGVAESVTAAVTLNVPVLENTWVVESPTEI